MRLNVVGWLSATMTTVFFVIVMLVSGSLKAQSQSLPPYTLEHNTWAQLVLPINGKEHTVGELFFDDIPRSLWSIFTFNATTQSYVEARPGSKIKQGEAFWIIQHTGQSVQLSLPSFTPPVDMTRADACVGFACAEVGLANSEGRRTWNMVGSPFSNDTPISSIRVEAPGNQQCTQGCSISAAATNGVIQDAIWHYDSNQGYVNIINAADLSAWQGVWMLAMGETNSDISLHIPDSSSPSTVSDPEFINTANSVTFSQIRVYEGHVELAQIENLAEINTDQVESGELVTVEVSFEISGDSEDYGFAVQLLPETIFSVLDSGDTLGEITNNEVYSAFGEGVFDLGGIYGDEVQPGLMHAVLHAKLPILEEQTSYKIAVLPTLAFLASGRDIHNEDTDHIPVLVDDRIVSVNALDEVRVEFAPNSLLNTGNEFTELEADAKFDAAGYSIEPLLQSSVVVDISSFRSTENVDVSVFWDLPDGTTYPLGVGLPENDTTGNTQKVLFNTERNAAPAIAEVATFSVEQNGTPTTTIPIVAHLSSEAYSQMFAMATPVQDLGSSAPQAAAIRVELSPSNSSSPSAVRSQTIFVPLISFRAREIVRDPLDITEFSILRSGNTNSRCLNVFPDIDTDFLFDEPQPLFIGNCPANPNAPAFLWRIDPVSRQIISAVTDRDGDNFCLTSIIAPFTPFQFVQVRQCNVPATADQQFAFDGNKLRLNSRTLYFDVQSFPGNPSTTQLQLISRSLPNGQPVPRSSVTGFYDDTEGLEVSPDGKVFHVVEEYDRSWGDKDIAEASLALKGETFLDYLPVIGATATGEARLSATLFSHSKDLIDMSFALKRYLPKRLSVTGANYPVSVVGNGAKFQLSLGGREVISRGAIVESDVSDFYRPGVDTDVAEELTPVQSQQPGLLSFTMDEDFVSQTIVVGIVPITIKGGVKGDFELDMNLTGPGFGVVVDAAEEFSLSGFLSAEVDAGVASAGIEANVEVASQLLEFSADGGFSASQLQPATQLIFNIGSSLQSRLSLLKGKIIAFVEYTKPRWGLPPWSTSRSEKTLYQSGYLFNSDTTIYDKRIATQVIDF